MKVSLITTIKNEEKNICVFLDSLLQQTRIPDEIIITDGGSTDNTCAVILTEYIPRYPFIQLIQDHCNIAKGRNLAIQASVNPIIAVTDAGCRLAKDWLENLVAPLECDDSIQVTGGITIPDTSTDFEKVTGAFFTVSLLEIQKNPHLISSRNIAFLKSIWQKVGGYPEWLFLSGEDTLFDKQLQNSGAKIKIVPNAIVYWKPITNFKKLFSQNFTYARGNGQAGFYKGLIAKTAIIYFMFIGLMIVSLYFPFTLFLLGLLVLTYFTYSGIKLCKKLNDPSVFILSIAVKMVIDVTNLYGYMVGIYLRTGDISKK